MTRIDQLCDLAECQRLGRCRGYPWHCHRTVAESDAERARERFLRRAGIEPEERAA